jgi:hypothetical protein
VSRALWKLIVVVEEEEVRLLSIHYRAQTKSILLIACSPPHYLSSSSDSMPQSQLSNSDERLVSTCLKKQSIPDRGFESPGKLISSLLAVIDEGEMLSIASK